MSNDALNGNKKETNKKICSYSLGYMGQGAAYNFMSTYFIVFMTDCVGMGSSLSGTIMSIALLVEVVSGMTVGNISDSCSSKMGKRRPFILFALLTLPLIIIMLFMPIDVSSTAKFIYYLIFSILFRISFSSYEIPGGALGAEIATGYDERTRLRTASRLFGIFGNTIAYIFPLIVLDMVKEASRGWQIASLVIASVCFFTWLATFILTKPYSQSCSTVHHNKNLLKEIGKNYIQLSKLKPMRILIIYKAAFSCAIALFNIGTVYYMRCCAGLSNTYISYVYFITSAVFLITTPIINKTALKFGKSNQQKFTLGMAGITGLVIFLFFQGSIIGTFVYIVMFAATQNSFWQLSTPIFYDIVEVDQFVNGKRREGDIVSMVSVLGTLITSIVVQIFGIFLDLSGYNASISTQPQGVSFFLSLAYVLVPSLCFIVASAALFKFPLNKKTFNALTEAVKKKTAGEDYSEYEEELNRILK